MSIVKDSTHQETSGNSQKETEIMNAKKKRKWNLQWVAMRLGKKKNSRARTSRSGKPPDPAARQPVKKSEKRRTKERKK